jgi:hypothetical protein
MGRMNNETLMREGTVTWCGRKLESLENKKTRVWFPKGGKHKQEQSDDSAEHTYSTLNTRHSSRQLS